MAVGLRVLECPAIAAIFFCCTEDAGIFQFLETATALINNKIFVYLPSDKMRENVSKRYTVEKHMVKKVTMNQF
jgi:hypothetical protein